MVGGRVVAWAGIAPAIVAAGLFAGMGSADEGKGSGKGLALSAILDARQEVPQPKGARATSGGAFVGTLTRTEAGGTVSWRLTFHDLSGRAAAAHLHIGARGRSGAVAIALCGPCRSGTRGSTRTTKRVVEALLAGRAYVNVHTARNPAGEIRGQPRQATDTTPTDTTTTDPPTESDPY